MRTIPNYSGIFLSLIKPLGTVTNQNKAFFLLHSSVVDIFDFKEILCFHSLNFIGIQIAFIFKLKASLTCLFNCRIIFPTFLLIIFYFPGIPSKDFPNSIFCSSKLIGKLSSILLRRHCNISFSETSVAILGFIVISNVGLFTILPCPASFSWKIRYYVIEYGFSLLLHILPLKYMCFLFSRKDMRRKDNS